MHLMLCSFKRKAWGLGSGAGPSIVFVAVAGFVGCHCTDTWLQRMIASKPKVWAVMEREAKVLLLTRMNLGAVQL